MTIVLILLCIVVVTLVILLFKKQNPEADNSSVMLKQDIDKLNENVLKMKEGLQDKLTERLDKNQSAAYKSSLAKVAK